LPNKELWVAMAVLTVVFKVLLIPLFKKQVRDQVVMSHLSPQLKQLQDKYKDKKDVLAKESMALYSKYKVNPLVSILILLIQLPFIIGLYQIFYYDINTYQHVLYTGNLFPTVVDYHFFGVNLVERSIFLALVAGITQYVLGAYMFKTKTEKEAADESDMIKAMNIQMKYFLPVMITVVSVVTPSVIALYMIITNVFGIIQEIIIKKPLELKIKKELNI
jgi:YidC/Oxa1 family membrane protein insertase